MASEQIRNEIWQERLDAERLVRYYEVLAERHRLRHLWIRIILLLAAIGGAVSLLKVIPQIFQLIAGLSVIVLVAVDFAFNGARKSAVLNLIQIECRALGNEWESLWIGPEQISDDDARRENERLARRLSEVTGWAGHAEVGEDQKLNVKCEELAYNVMRERYASG